ncbi:MAG: hypothetical protein WA628_21945 [Terriglobales bacterium]
MKFVNYAAVLGLVTLSMSLGVLAKDKNEGKFTLRDSVQLGSTQLKPGDYKATWEGAGPDVQVKILQGKNVVATSSAKLVDRSSNQDSVSVGSASNSRELQEIDFGNLRKALVFGAEVTARN